jgi:hypothetical protein
VRLPKLDRILSEESALQPVLAKTRELRALAGLVDGFLSADLARQVRVVNFREGAVVVEAANSAAAAKIRLLGPSLSRFLAERRWQVNSVSVRVQPNTPRIGAPQKAADLPAAALIALKNLHASMADSPARDALRTLLERRGLMGPDADPKSPLPRTGAGSPKARKPKP